MKLVFIALFLFVFATAKAQFNVQCRTGLNISSIKYNYEKNVFFQDNWRTTPFLGININVNLHPNTSFSTGIEYTLKGEKRILKDSMVKNIKVVTDLNYITIPILIKQAFKTRKYKVVCGITANLAIIRALNSIHENKENNRTISFNNVLKPFDLCGLIGVEYPIKQKISMQLYYSNSILNSAYKNFESAYNRSFQLVLAYQLH